MKILGGCIQKNTETVLKERLSAKKNHSADTGRVIRSDYFEQLIQLFSEFLTCFERSII